MPGSETRRDRPRWVKRLAAAVASVPRSSGFFVNVLSPVDRWLLRVTHGRVCIAALGVPTLLLETVGARSGRPRSIPLAYAPDGARVIVIGSGAGRPEHPAWVHNLRAHPEVTCAVGGRRRVFKARELEGEERARAWARALEVFPGYAAYEERVSSRVIPVIALDPVDGDR